MTVLIAIERSRVRLYQVHQTSHRSMQADRQRVVGCEKRVVISFIKGTLPRRGSCARVFETHRGLYGAVAVAVAVA